MTATDQIPWRDQYLTMAGVISYRAGLFGLREITVVRAVVNGHRHNTMAIDKAMYFPLRQP